jgi:hypothetical protein
VESPTGPPTALTANQGAGAPTGMVMGDPFGPIVARRLGDYGEIFQDRTSNLRSSLQGTAVSIAVFWSVWSVFALLDGDSFPTGPLIFTLASTIMNWRTARSWWRARRIGRLPPLERLGGPPSPDPVRVVGRVEACGETFTEPGGVRQVVYARSLYYLAGINGRPNGTACEEVRAVPFRIRLPDGRSVRLRLEDLRLEDVPVQVNDVAPAVLEDLGAAQRGPMFRRQQRLTQATLAPGDEVEAAGLLVPEVDVTGEAAPSRGAPLAHRLVPLPDGPIFIRGR